MLYNKDIIESIENVIPCMHMPTKKMAIKSLREFKQYAEFIKANNLSIDDLINDIEKVLKENEQ